MDDDVVKNLILDPAIKLFGKSIQLPESLCVEAGAGVDDVDDVDERRSCGMDSGLEDESDDEGTLNGEEPVQEQENSNSQKTNQRNDTSGTDRIIEKPIPRTEEENNNTVVQEEKTLKKPDKIIPCPRCDSMDTKFCYFNNYNVNQPRYFCRKCQRYWTSGGTMRNLPVGAGRRKSKSSTVHYPNPTIAPHGDFSNGSAPHGDFSNGSVLRLNGTLHRPVALNGAVLSFAQDQHIHQPCPANAVELARLASAQNGSTNPLTEVGVVIDDNATKSAGSVTNVENEDEYKAKTHTAQSYQNFQPQMMCYPAPLWPPFPWNPAQYNYPLPGPINTQPAFPVPFYPAPMYVGCTVPQAWNLPWSPPPSSSPNTQPDPKSPTLGKRPRDHFEAKPINAAVSDSDKESPKPSIWVPKTLRIDDLEEAAKSSMLATLGIKTDNIVSTGGKLHYKPFSSLANETTQPMTTSSSSSLLANPAALSRSMNFHEST